MSDVEAEVEQRAAQPLAVKVRHEVGVRPVFAKAKASKEDFYFQDTPGDNGENCSGCINFTPKSTGLYGKDSGDCALVEGDVCTHCFCQGWTDKNAPGAKRAGS